VRPLAAIIALVALAACGEQREPIQRPPERVLVTPPALLLECQGAPAVPDADTQRAVAAYLVQLEAAGADCRSKLAAVRRFIERQTEK
jgi:predicted small lipoprotein YifL